MRLITEILVFVDGRILEFGENSSKKLGLSGIFKKVCYNSVLILNSKGKNMAKRCLLSGKGPMVGNHVSHANNKTKRRLLPNLRRVKLKLEDGNSIYIKVAASTLRTMRKRA